MKKLWMLLAVSMVLGLAAVAYANPSWWVGIGTTTPNSPLHVAVDAGSGGNLQGHILVGPASTLTEGLSIGYDSTDHYAWMQSGNYGSDPYHNIILQPQSGNVGVNTTTPGSRLTVYNGDIEIKIASDWYYQSQGGIILHAPDGHCARVMVANNNSLSATTITCP
jgi:hypothetical protein